MSVGPVSNMSTTEVRRAWQLTSAAALADELRHGYQTEAGNAARTQAELFGVELLRRGES